MLNKTRKLRHLKIFIPIIAIILIGGLILFFSLKSQQPQKLTVKNGAPVPEALATKEANGKDTLAFVFSKDIIQNNDELTLIKAMYKTLSSELNITVFWENGIDPELDIPKSNSVDLKGEYKIESQQNFIVNQDGIINFVNDSANIERLTSHVTEKYVTDEVRKDVVQYMSSTPNSDGKFRVMFCFESLPMADEIREKYSPSYTFSQVGGVYTDGSSELLKDTGSFFEKALGIKKRPTYVTYAPGEEPKWVIPS